MSSDNMPRRRSTRVCGPPKRLSENTVLRNRKAKSLPRARKSKLNELNSIKKELEECNHTVFTLIKRLGRANSNLIQLISQHRHVNSNNGGYRTS